MEDQSLQISAIEKDDSFSMLYASLDASKRNHKDEKAEVGFLLGKLSDVRNKYQNICLSMAENLDNVEAKHAEENIARQAEFTAKLKELEKTIHTCATELHSQNAEKNAANTLNLLLKESLGSIRDQINNLFEHINRNIQNAVEDVVDIVTVASDSEDEQDHEQDNEEEQHQAAEDSVGSAEVVQNEQVAHETEHVQQNVSNGDAHDETAKPNENDDDGKENVRPQSTPIAKVEMPAVIPDMIPSSVSTIEIVTKVVAPPKPPLIELAVAKNIDEPGTSGISQPNKQYNCVYCDESFPKKSLVFHHWKNDHDIKVRRVKSVCKSGSSKRKRAAIDNNAENVDDDIIEVDSGNGFYVTLHGSLKKKKDAKRLKKSSP